MVCSVSYYLIYYRVCTIMEGCAGLFNMSGARARCAGCPLDALLGMQHAIYCRAGTRRSLAGEHAPSQTADTAPASIAAVLPCHSRRCAGTCSHQACAASCTASSAQRSAHVAVEFERGVQRILLQRAVDAQLARLDRLQLTVVELFEAVQLRHG